MTGFFGVADIVLNEGVFFIIVLDYIIFTVTIGSTLNLTAGSKESLVVIVEVSIPNEHGLVVTTSGNNKGVIRSKLDPGDVTAVAVVVVESGLLFGTGVLEQFHYTEVIASGEQLAVAGAIGRVHIRVVKARPDSLHRPSEDACHGLPFDRLRGRSANLLL